MIASLRVGSLSVLTIGLVGASLAGCRPEPLDPSVGLPGEGEGEGEAQASSDGDNCEAICEKVLGCPDAPPPALDMEGCRELCRTNEDRLQARAHSKLVGCLNNTNCDSLPTIAGGGRKDLLTTCLETLDCEADEDLAGRICATVDVCGLTVAPTDCIEDVFHRANHCLRPTHRDSLGKCVEEDQCDQVVRCLPFGPRGLVGCQQAKEFCLAGCSDSYANAVFDPSVDVDGFRTCLDECAYGGCAPMTCDDFVHTCAHDCSQFAEDEDGLKSCLQACMDDACPGV